MTTIETLEAMRDRWLEDSSRFLSQAESLRNTASSAMDVGNYHQAFASACYMKKCAMELDLAITLMKLKMES